MIASRAQHGARHRADHRGGVMRADRARACAARDGDEGFSLIEVVVAMVVLAITAMAVLTVLLNGVSVSKAARQRVAASNLASREIEIVRNPSTPRRPTPSRWPRRHADQPEPLWRVRSQRRRRRPLHGDARGAVAPRRQRRERLRRRLAGQLPEPARPGPRDLAGHGHGPAGPQRHAADAQQGHPRHHGPVLRRGQGARTPPAWRRSASPSGRGPGRQLRPDHRQQRLRGLPGRRGRYLRADAEHPGLGRSDRAASCRPRPRWCPPASSPARR